MSDWYNEGYRRVVQNAANFAGVTADQARAVYSSLAEAGLIDYDVEKEIFYAVVHGEEE